MNSSSSSVTYAIEDIHRGDMIVVDAIIVNFFHLFIHVQELPYSYTIIIQDRAVHGAILFRPPIRLRGFLFLGMWTASLSGLVTRIIISPSPNQTINVETPPFLNRESPFLPDRNEQSLHPRNVPGDLHL